MRFILEAPQQAPYITGTDRIAYNVIKHLQNLDLENDYTVICSHDYHYIPSIINAGNFHIRYRESYSRAQLLIRLPISFARLLHRKMFRQVDAFCSFHNLSSPPIKYAPIISFGLDLIPLIFPNWYHASLPAREMYRRRLARARKSVDRFIAISHHTKSDLVKHLDIDPDRIDVVYLAADERFAPIVEEEELSIVRDRYRLPSRFLLTAGSNEPRKNVGTAVHAFARIPDRLRKGCSLVVIGPPWRDQPLGNGNAQVLFLGEVDDRDLPAIYSLGTAFVFLSLYEGFGLPVLEAMACGTPVIASATTSVPEVVGSAGILVDPEDVEATTQAMVRVLDDPSFAEELQVSGLARAEAFGWDRTARSVLDVLKRVSSQT